MATRRFEVEFVGDAKSLERTFKTVGAQSSSFARKLGTQFGTKGKIAGAGLDTVRTAATRAGSAVRTATPYLTAFAALGIAKTVDEAREANKALAQTRAVIKSTGGVAGVSAAHLEHMARDLSEIVGQDDEIIQQGGNLLLTFRNVRNEAGKNNDIYDRTLALTLDLAAATKTDLTSAVKQVGKALHDPAVGLTALRRSGVSFSEQQAEMINKLFESGEKLKAQKLILRELSTEFKGSAASQADAIDRLQVTFGNLAEEIGLDLMPEVSALASELTDIITSKDLTDAEKFDKVFGMVEGLAEDALEGLSEVAPEVAATGAKLGIKFLGAFAEAFVESDLLGKLFLAGGFIRLIGGPGALLGVGKGIGRFIGVGIATEAAATAAAGGAAGGAAGAAAGAGGGLLATMRSKLIPVAKRVGLLGVGVALGDSVLNEFETRVKERSDDALTALEGLGAHRDVRIGLFEDGGFPVDITFGESDLEEKANELRSRLEELFASDERISMAKALDLRQAAKDAGLTGEALDALSDDLFKLVNSAPSVRQALGSVLDDLKRGKLDWKAMDEFERTLEQMPSKARRQTAQMALGMIEELRQKGRITGEQARLMTQQITGELDFMERSGTKSGKRLMKSLGLSFKQIERIVSGRTSGALEATATALRVFGASGAARVKAEAARLKAIKGGDFGGGLQKGGLAAVVPGSSTGDRHVLSVDGVPVAGVESREGVFVGNREMMREAAAANAMFPRFGLQEGGLAFALGPYTIPPIEYDPNHAGGNSHVHISGSPPSWVIGIGKKLQSMGWSVGEHPAFGGVTADHGHYGPTDHYHGGAIDANTAEDETRSQVAAVARLLNSGKVGAAVGMAMKLLARMDVSGPPGSIRDTAQAALDQVVKQGNKFLRKQHGKGGGFGEPGGLGGPGQVLGASVYGFGEPGTGTVGASGESLPGKMAYAELGMGHAMGHLPFGHKLDLSVGNREVMAEKLDIGLGGGDVQGHPRVIDLWYDTARALGLGGTWSGLVKAQGLMRGGLLQMLQEGGIVDPDKVMRQLFGAPGPGERRDILDQARKRVNKRTSMDVLSPDGSVLAGPLADLREKVDEYAENASAAADFGLTDPNGNLIPGSNVYGGLDEAGWINEQLAMLWNLRNHLVRSSGTVADKTNAVAKILKRIQGPKGLVAKINERIKKIKKDIRDLEDARKKLEDDLEDASDDKEKSEKAIQDRLDAELAKDPKKRDEEKIKRLREQLRAKSSEKEAIRELLGLNREQTREANQALTKQTTVRDDLRGPLSQVLGAREEALKSGADLITEELRTVQGSGVTMDDMTGQALPELGMFKGEIKDAQLALRELGAAQAAITDSGSAERETLLEEELRAARSAFAVQEAQVRALLQVPYMGEFGGGGIALVGENGPELAHMPDGTRIHSYEDSQRLLSPTVIVNGDITNVPAGKDPVEVVLGDRRFVPAVQRALSGVGSRPTPGQAGVMRP